MSTDKTTLPPLNIRPGERYTDAGGRTWELTDHGQWKEVHDAPLAKFLSAYRKDRIAAGPPDPLVTFAMVHEIDRLRGALAELLSGHDNLYRAHWGHLPTCDPTDDIAAKAARALLSEMTE